VTDGQTDRQTDRQTDGIAIAYARLAYMLSRAIIANRKNGVPVDDKDAEDCESDWFSRKSTQKHAQLHTNRAYTEKYTAIFFFSFIYKLLVSTR